jgi:hypothetical protein
MYGTMEPAYTITGRFTLDELTRLAGTMAWNASIPEMRHVADEHAMHELVRLAGDYMRLIPGAVAVDVLEGQIVNVVHKEHLSR